MPDTLEPDASRDVSPGDDWNEFFGGRRLPTSGTPMNLLGVDYLHVPTQDGGDLYVTKFGLPFVGHLNLENWREDHWFSRHREELTGTSTVYKVPTREIDGQSLDLVVKWCRVGEEVPIDTLTFDRFAHAQFNSPYEEFALVMEMRDRPDEPTIRTNLPLAIYVPAERFKLWQTGRLKTRMARKTTKFRDVELDINRQYILIYQWVKGECAVDAFDAFYDDPDECRDKLAAMTHRVHDDLEKNGFTVIDHKPAHIIVRPRPDGSLLRGRDGDFEYALVDFELLTRTQDHEHEVQAQRRAEYLQHQEKRFMPEEDQPFPDYLRRERIFGVDYVCGHTGSTHGMLWVVGRDPLLFDYFLPERWRRTPKQRLSETNDTFYTLTKDSINLVWKVSRVGEQPEVDPMQPSGRALYEHGYNSPFEEFALAMELAAQGIETVYPRAIYMSGLESPTSGLYTFDDSRYASHQGFEAIDGHEILRRDHNYLTIWGYWNGVDEMLARHDEAYCKGLDLCRALERGYISCREREHLLEREAGLLAAAGYESIGLKPSHFLLSLRPDGTLAENDQGELALRICNLEMIRRKDLQT